MNIKLLSAVALSFIAMSCSLKDESNKTDKSSQEPPVSRETTVEDDQVFAYMLGTQFGRQGVENAPYQIGAHLDVDAVVQGILDAANGKPQMDENAEKAVDSIYNVIVTERMEKLRPDSATKASFGGDRNKYRAFVDSVNKTLPMEPEIPMKNEPVTLNENSTFGQKYSYRTGLQLFSIFGSVSKQLEKKLEAESFARGIREVAMNIADSTATMWLSEDSLRNINARYVKIMQSIRQEKRSKGN